MEFEKPSCPVEFQAITNPLEPAELEVAAAIAGKNCSLVM